MKCLALVGLIALALILSGCVEPPICGNDICETYETDDLCPQDCPETICGDGVCEENEDCSQDCPEAAPAAVPGKCHPTTEVCDGEDNDCDSLVDEENVCPATDYSCDLDEDGHNAKEASTCYEFNCIPDGCSQSLGIDCDDTNSEIYQSLEGICHDGIIKLPGDATGDCVVDEFDYEVFKDNFGVTGGGWGQANFDGDEITDLRDFTAMRNNFGNGCVGETACESLPDAGKTCGVQDHYCDSDSDGFVSEALSGTCDTIDCVPEGCTQEQGNDCSDSDPTSNPEADEVCGDEVDNNCDGEIDEYCTPGAPVCAPFFSAAWSDDGDILAGEFDSTTDTSYLSVVPSHGGYALQARGVLGSHTWKKVLREDIGSLQTWGGLVSVNLKDVDHYNRPQDLAFVGAFEDVGQHSGRDFAIVADMMGLSNRYIYVKGYHNNDQSVSFLSDIYFDVEDATTSWPDRYITIEWYFTPSYKLFVSVDGSEWRETTVGSHLVNHEVISVGWVSSYSGGNLKINKVELYDQDCVPQWVLDN